MIMSRYSLILERNWLTYKLQECRVIIDKLTSLQTKNPSDQEIIEIIEKYRKESTIISHKIDLINREIKEYDNQ